MKRGEKNMEDTTEMESIEEEKMAGITLANTFVQSSEVLASIGEIGIHLLYPAEPVLKIFNNTS